MRGVSPGAVTECSGDRGEGSHREVQSGSEGLNRGEMVRINQGDPTGGEAAEEETCYRQSG